MVTNKIVFYGIPFSTAIQHRAAILEELQHWSRTYSTQYDILVNHRMSLHVALPKPEYYTLWGMTWNRNNVPYLRYRILDWI